MLAASHRHVAIVVRGLEPDSITLGMETAVWFAIAFLWRLLHAPARGAAVLTWLVQRLQDTCASDDSGGTAPTAMAGESTQELLQRATACLNAYTSLGAVPTTGRAGAEESGPVHPAAQQE